MGSRGMLGAALRRAARALPLRARMRGWLASLVRAMRMHQTGASSGLSQRVTSDGRAIGYRDAAAANDAPPVNPRVVAFYLPQFHPVPENNAWWGQGFTEWHNVTRALPQFEDHTQPKLPGALGFYDLRLVEVMAQQVALARANGVAAFCFYAYWFGGRRILERPLENYASNRHLDLPFCVCWANEPWTRRWDGREDEVLLAQQHTPDDDLAFVEWLITLLRDPRYFRINRCPLVVVYRIDLMPDPRATAQRWRDACRRAGIGEIHLAMVESFARVDPRRMGFDSAIEFPPNLVDPHPIRLDVAPLNPYWEGEALDWHGMSVQFRTRTRPPYPLFRGVNVSWDNEPRRPGRGRSFVGAAVRSYEEWLRDALSWVPEGHGGADRTPVFVNAWNEWAEGATLEPDARLGHAWLQATRRAQLPLTLAQQRPCAIIHAHHVDLLDEVLEPFACSRHQWRLCITVPQGASDHARRLATRRKLAVEISEVGNRGRDVLPFLCAADVLLDEGEDVVLKLHTKRSPHLANGDQWRRELLSLLTAPETMDRVTTAFYAAPDLGLVGPEGHALPLQDHMGGNAETFRRLLQRLRIHDPPPSALFFAGSMYWLRLRAIRPLLDAHINVHEFEPELGQLDGTYAHAIERMMTYLVQQNGFRIGDTRDPSGITAIATAKMYSYVPKQP